MRYRRFFGILTVCMVAVWPLSGHAADYHSNAR
jgi:hypothetical protein